MSEILYPEAMHSHVAGKSLRRNRLSINIKLGFLDSLTAILQRLGLEGGISPHCTRTLASARTVLSQLF